MFRTVLWGLAAAFAFAAEGARFAVPEVSPAVYCDAARSIGMGDTNAETVVICIHGWGGGVKESGVGFTKEPLINYYSFWQG